MSNDNANERELIDKFLADNPELEELTARLEDFNVFHALRLENHEIRHSNVLAWLLNPDATHGLGDIFLRRVLSNMLLESEINIEDISAAKVELMDFVDIEVLRESMHIDLLIVDHKNNYVVLIENKIHSSERKGQIASYHHKVEKEYPSFTVIPVFLTLTGQEMSDDDAPDCIIYSHAQILSVIGQIYRQRKTQMADAVSIFLKHYMEVLRRLTMEDQELIDLCKKIYRKHKSAIDLIQKYGMSGVGQQVVEDIFNEEGLYTPLCSRSYAVWFIPRAWSQIVPQSGSSWGHLSQPYCIVCWFSLRGDRIILFFELSTMDDPEVRLKCANMLKDAGFKLTKKAFRKDAKFSRFYNSSSKKIDDMNDEEEIRAAISNLLRRAKPKFEAAEKVFIQLFTS